MATTTIPLEELVLNKLGGRESQSILDDPAEQEKLYLREITLYNKALTDRAQQEFVGPPPPPTPEPRNLVQQIGDVASSVGETLAPALPSREQPLGIARYIPSLEPSVAATSGLLTTGVGGLTAAAKYLGRVGSELFTGKLTPGRLEPQPEDAEWMDYIQNNFAYQPRTTLGNLAFDAMNLPFHAFKKVAEGAGDLALNLGAPAPVAATIATASEIGLLFALDRSLRRTFRSSAKTVRDFQQAVNAYDHVKAGVLGAELVKRVPPLQIEAAKERLLAEPEIRSKARNEAAGLLEKYNAGPLALADELNLLKQIRDSIPTELSRRTILGELGYSPNEANILNARMSLLDRVSSKETLAVQGEINRFKNPNSSRADRIEAIERIRAQTAVRNLADLGFSEATQAEFAPLLRQNVAPNLPESFVEDIAARDAAEGLPIYSPEGEFLPQGAPPVAGDIAQQNAQRALAEARAIRRGEEPPPPTETLPVEPTPPIAPTAPTGEALAEPPSRPAAPSEVTLTQLPQRESVLTALDIFLDNSTTITAKQTALAQIKREALNLVPGNVERGLRQLGLEEELISDLLPRLKNVRAAKPVAAPPAEIAIDIPPQATPADELARIPPQEPSVQNLTTTPPAETIPSRAEVVEPEPLPTKTPRVPRQRRVIPIEQETQLAPPTRDLPAQETMFQRYRNKEIAVDNVPIPELAMGEMLRRNGVTLGFTEFNQMAAEISSLEPTREALTNYMNAFIRERQNLAETSAKLNDGDQLNPKQISVEDRAQYIEAGQLMSLEQIYENLANGVDISADLSPSLAKIYTRALKYHNRKLTQAQRRSFDEIKQSIADLFPEIDPNTLGAFNLGDITPRQKLALQQLYNDAVREGKNFVDIIRELTLSDPRKDLYIEYLRTTNAPPEPGSTRNLANMPFDAEAAARGDFVIQRRENKEFPGTFHPPVYQSGLDAMKNAPEMTRPGDRNIIQRSLRPNWMRTNGIRVFQRLGLEDWMYAYREAEQALTKEEAATFKANRKFGRQFTSEQRRAIGAYGISLQPKGVDLLRTSNIPIRELSAKEMDGYNYIRTQFEDYFARLQDVRAANGVEPLEYIDNYMTFMRSVIENERGQVRTELGAADNQVIMDRFAHSRDMPFPSEKTRTNKLYPVEVDAFNILNQYARYALEYIHLTPFRAMVHEHINVPIKNPVTGETFNLAQEKPVMHTFLNNWLDYISRKPVSYEAPAGMRRFIYTMDQNLAGSYMAFNPKSALSQFTSLAQAYIEVGEINMAKAIARWLVDPLTGFKQREFRRANSKLLDIRNLEIPMNEFADGVMEGVLSRAKGKEYVSSLARNVVRAGTFAMRIFDGISASIAWDAGYLMATRRGLNQKDAANFADDVVTRTQGTNLRGDRSNIQRTIWGRAITRFQSYAINNWDQITHDTIGIENPNLSMKEKAQRISRLMFIIGFVSSTINNIFGDTPLPNPLGKAVEIGVKGPRENESEGGFLLRLLQQATLGEALKMAPIIGSARFPNSSGVGPQADYIRDLARSASGQPGARSFPDMLLRGFVPGGATISNALKPERENQKSFATRGGREGRGGRGNSR